MTVKIAIIDSGVNDYIYNNYKKIIIDRVNYSLDLCSSDQTNHGTMVFNIIRNNLNNVPCNYHIVKIFSDANKTSLRSLLQALEYIKCNEIDIVNLSTAIHENIDDDLKKILMKNIQEVIDSDKIIITSVANNQRFSESFPANLNGIIGVNGTVLENETDYWYNKLYPCQAVADVTPRITQVNDNTYDIIGGNSKAAAIITTIHASLYDKYSKKELQDIIQKKSICQSWKISDIRDNLSESKCVSVDVNSYIYICLQELFLSKGWTPEEINKTKWSISEVVKAVNIVIKHENIFEHSICDGIKYWDICNIKLLAKYIREKSIV